MITMESKHRSDANNIHVGSDTDTVFSCVLRDSISHFSVGPLVGWSVFLSVPPGSSPTLQSRLNGFLENFRHVIQSMDKTRRGYFADN